MIVCICEHIVYMLSMIPFLFISNMELWIFSMITFMVSVLQSEFWYPLVSCNTCQFQKYQMYQVYVILISS